MAVALKWLHINLSNKRCQHTLPERGIIGKIFNHNEKVFDRNRHRYYHRVWKQYKIFSHVAYYHRDHSFWPHRGSKIYTIFVSIASLLLCDMLSSSILIDRQCHIRFGIVQSSVYIFQVCLFLLLLLRIFFWHLRFACIYASHQTQCTHTVWIMS